MANLSNGISLRQVSSGAVNVLQVELYAGIKAYQGLMYCRRAADGYAVPAGTAGTGRVQGIALADSAPCVVSGDTNVNLLTGQFVRSCHATHTPGLTDIGKAVYAADDHTISNVAGDGPVAGVLTGFEDGSGDAIFFIAPESPSDPNVLRARAVATSIAAYTGTGTGTLTGSANGAIGAQDGLTLAAGDVVIVPAGITNVTAADAGPYVVTTVGDGSTKYVLTRPFWWSNGGPLRQGAIIEVGGEGSAWSGSSWKTLCAGSKVIGTDDPKLYPKVVKGSQALSGGTATVSNLQLWTAAYACAQDTTAAAATKVVLTAGQGTGSLVLTGTTTDTIAYVATNW